MKIIRPKVELQKLGTVDEGKQLELSAEIDNEILQLITIKADDKDESLWFEIYEGNKAIQIPIKKLEEVIKIKCLLI